MGAKRKPVTRDMIAELNYWRGIRLDCPERKDEALHNIDNLLEELHASQVGTEAEKTSQEKGA